MACFRPRPGLRSAARYLILRPYVIGYNAPIPPMPIDIPDSMYNEAMTINSLYNIIKAKQMTCYAYLIRIDEVAVISHDFLMGGKCN